MCDFYLPRDEKRKYELKVEDDMLTIKGDYWVYQISDIYKRNNSMDTVSIKEYLGMGKLKMRPLRYVYGFIVIPFIIRWIIEILNHWVFRVFESNAFINIISDIGNVLLNILLIVFVIHGVRLIFSLKDLVEISFVSKHICIPRKSLTDLQYKTLNEILKG